jgi:sulfite exporter TauE/SafE
MLNTLYEGILLGLLTSINCTVFCLPVLFGMSINSGKLGLSVNKTVFLFLTGKLIVYLFIGYLSGMIGEAIFKSGYVRLLCYITISILLFILGINGLRNKKIASCVIRNKIIKTANPFIIGILLGLSPCPPLFAAITRAVSFQNWVDSLIYFFGFFISSSIFLLMPILLKNKIKMPQMKMTLAYVSILFCFVFLCKSLVQLIWLMN